MKRAGVTVWALCTVAILLALLARSSMLRTDLPSDSDQLAMDDGRGIVTDIGEKIPSKASSRMSTAQEEEGAGVTRAESMGLEARVQIRLHGAAEGLLLTEVTALELNESTKRLLTRTHYCQQLHTDAVVLRSRKVSETLWHIERPTILVPVGVIVISKGYRAQAVVLHPDDWLRSNEIVVNLERSSPLNIRVLGEDGSPLEGARVHVRSDDLGLSDLAPVEELFEKRWLWLIAETSAVGEITVEDPPSGLVSVFVEPSGRHASAILWSQNAFGEVVLQCRMAYSIIGKVVSRTETEVPKLGLTVMSTDGRWSEIPLQYSSTEEGGVFKFESVPADGTMHYVLITDERYVPSRTDYYVPEGARVVELTLTAQPATQSKIRVQTAGRVPMPGLACSIFGESSGRLPIVLTTDAGGILEIPGYLHKDEKYSLRVNLGGCEVTSDVFEVSSEAGEPSLATVSGVSRILSVMAGNGAALESDRPIEFYPASNAEGYSSTFDSSALPVFLPAGGGNLVVEVAEGIFQSEYVFLPENEDVNIVLSSASARLEFEVSAPDLVGVSVLNMQRYPTARFTSPSNRLQCDLVPGDYIVLIERVSDSEEVGPVHVPPSGLMLGVLDIGAGAAVSGRVSADNGRPIEGVPIVAYGPRGYRSSYSFTDDGGHYGIDGLPAGEYVVECMTGRILGGTSPSTRVKVFLGCNANVADVNFAVTSGEVKLEFDVLSGAGAVGSFALSGDRSIFVDGAQSRAMTIPSSMHPIIVGFWERSSGSLALHLESLPEGTLRHYVGRKALKEYRVPASGGITSVRVLGHSLGVDVPINDLGQGILRTNKPKDIEVLTVAASGEYQWQPLDSLSESRADVQLLISTMDGSPIPGAVVVGRGSSERGYSDAAGSLKLQLMQDEWIWVDHSEYWAIQQQASKSLMHVQLRRSSVTDFIPFEFLPNAATARIAPLFDLGYDFLGESATLSRGEFGWNFPPVPSGEYSCLLISDSGSRSYYSLRLTEADGYSVLPN